MVLIRGLETRCCYVFISLTHPLISRRDAEDIVRKADFGANRASFHGYVLETQGKHKLPDIKIGPSYCLSSPHPNRIEYFIRHTWLMVNVAIGPAPLGWMTVVSR